VVRRPIGLHLKSSRYFAHLYLFLGLNVVKMDLINSNVSLFVFTSAIGFLLYVLALAVYRLFLHPLSHIPGPILAKLTTWHECYYDLWLPGKHPWKLQDMHDKYGPIIRPVPNEVHIIDPSFLDTIFATRGRNSPFSGGLMVDQAVGAAVDWHLHKIRRDALNPFFTPKAIMSLGDRLLAKRDKFVEILATAAKSEKPLNLYDAFWAFSNDVVRSFCFGFDNDLLADLSTAKEQRKNLARLLTGVPVNTHFPWFQKGLGKLLTALFGPKAMPPAIMDMIKFRAKVGQDIAAILADPQDKEKQAHSVFYELRDSPSLPPKEKTLSRLQDEAMLLVMAGTDSPAKSMSIAAYYLLANPSTMEKMREELSSARRSDKLEEVPLSKLINLPYMNAVIHEADRLSFGVTKRSKRFAPSDTLSYTAISGPYMGTTYVFPPGTILCSSSYCLHTDESVFPDALEWKPERWLTEDQGGTSSVEQVNMMKRSMMALGKGHRKCVGMHLATAELCLVLEAISRYNMQLFETDETDVKFQHNYQISHPRLDSEGVRVLVEQRRS
jgi:cytochrome P450